MNKMPTEQLILERFKCWAANVKNQTGESCDCD